MLWKTDTTSFSISKTGTVNKAFPVCFQMGNALVGKQK